MTPTKTVHLPDGSQGISIDCAYGGEWSGCMNKAAQLCGRYTILAQNDGSSGSATMPVGTMALAIPISTKEMIVQCEK